MISNPVKIADVLTTEYSDFLDYCIFSGKTYKDELSNADYIAFRTSKGLSREYVAGIRKRIEEYFPESLDDEKATEKSNQVNEVEDATKQSIQEVSTAPDNVDFVQDVRKNDALEHMVLIVDSPYSQYSEDAFQSTIDRVKETSKGLKHNTNGISVGKDAPSKDDEHPITLDFIETNCLEEVSLASLLQVDPEHASDVDVSYLGLSVRSNHCLRSVNCNLLKDLLMLNISELKKIRNMGSKSVSEILIKLQNFFRNEMPGKVKNKRTSKESSNVLNAAKALLFGGDVDFESLSDEEYTKYLNYKEAYDTLGPEFSRMAFDHDNRVFALFEALNSFANPIIEYMEIVKEASHHIGKLSATIKGKKALPFINAYEVVVNYDIIKLRAICNDDTCIYQLPDLLEKYKNSGDFKALSKDVNQFLIWLDFDINEIIKLLVNKIKDVLSSKNSRAVDIFKMRLEGKSLEEIGAIMSITRERVRQIEHKVYRIFWNIYRHQSYDLIMLVYAIREGDTIIYYDELYNTIGEFAAIMWACLKKNENTEHYEYSKELNALMIHHGESIDSSMTLKSKIVLAMREMPEIFETQELSHILETYTAKYVVPQEVLKKIIDENYKIAGKFYYKGRLTVIYMCEYVLKERFPAGYKIADEYEANRFKQYLAEFFGEQAKTMTSRAIDAKVMELGCLCDRGKYIHKDTLYVDNNIIQAINDYVENSSRRALSYAEVYDGLIDTLSGSQITNRYLLQGALKKYGCKFRTSRDYILKEDGISVADELDSFIEQYGVIYKGDIFAEFHSFDDIRLGQVITRCPNVYSIDNGYYIHASVFDIRPSDYFGLREYLEHACKDIPVNIRAVYDDLSLKFPQFMSRNDFDDRNKLFAALNHMFGSEYKFSRPYIAKLGTGDISNRSVILQHLKDFDSIEIDELIGICESNNIHYACLSYLWQLLAPDFIRVDKDTLMRSKIAGVDTSVIQKTAEVISEQLEYRDYIVASKYDDFIWLPDISVDWNPFVLESIGRLNKNLNTVLLIGNPLLHPSTVFVSSKYIGDTFVTMILKILRDKVLQGYFNTKVEMREWLLEEGLIEGKVPNVLEGAQYFFVSDKGVQYTGKDIE